MHTAANQTTQTTTQPILKAVPQKALSLPEEQKKFIRDFTSMYIIVASLLEGGETFNEFKHEFLQRVWETYLISEDFAKLDVATKRRIISYSETMHYLLEQFSEFFDSAEYGFSPERFQPLVELV